MLGQCQLELHLPAKFLDPGGVLEPIEDRAMLDAVELGAVTLRPALRFLHAIVHGREDGRIGLARHGHSLEVLPALERMALAGEADTTAFAAMYDRVQKSQGEPQRYGTQFDCVEHRPVLYRLEDPARVEEFRRQMKFELTLAEHVRGLEQRQVGC